jgi:CRISPR-associated protein Cas1
MGYRTVMIAGDVRLSVNNNQLVVEGEKSGVIPIEDISAVLVESRRSTITTAALSMLSKEGVCCLFCDEKHMPCGVLLPLSSYYRQLRRINLQSQATLPRKKQLLATGCYSKNLKSGNLSCVMWQAQSQIAALYRSQRP